MFVFLASIFPALPRVRETVIPAKAGIYTESITGAWIPAFAGMTGLSMAAVLVAANGWRPALRTYVFGMALSQSSTAFIHRPYAA